MTTIETLREEIRERQDKIKAIQDACSHPPPCVTKTHGGSTGNYDPTNDCYWTDFHCSLCDKRWTEDGSK